jgi:hypothetical protein
VLTYLKMRRLTAAPRRTRGRRIGTETGEKWLAPHVEERCEFMQDETPMG